MDHQRPEIAVAGYVDYFDYRRFHGEIDLIPLVEFEDQRYIQITGMADARPALGSGH